MTQYYTVTSLITIYKIVDHFITSLDFNSKHSNLFVIKPNYSLIKNTLVKCFSLTNEHIYTKGRRIR